jgi:hypothetical protein
LTDEPLLTGKARGSIFDAITPAMLQFALARPGLRRPQPEPGFWMIRKAPRAAPVPAAIIRYHTTSEPGEPENRMDRSPFLVAYIAGRPVPLIEVWHWREREIEEWEYRHAVDDLEWLRRYRPGDPKVQSKKPVDWRRVEMPF